MASKKLKELTDEELLMELRRRGRLRRVVVEQIIPGFRVHMSSCPPDEYMISKMAQEVGYEIGQKLLAGRFKIPGNRIERGKFINNPDIYQDKKFILPLNFVVEP